VTVVRRTVHAIADSSLLSYETLKAKLKTALARLYLLDRACLISSIRADIRLNSQAIKAKLTGELASEDFDVLKQNIAEEIEKIEAELSVLEQERKMLLELRHNQSSKRSACLPRGARPRFKASSNFKRPMFSDDLVWSHESGFLNQKNTLLIDSLKALCQQLSDPKEAAERLIVKFGVPEH
jgi:hypothetical protein